MCFYHFERASALFDIRRTLPLPQLSVKVELNFFLAPRATFLIFPTVVASTFNVAASLPLTFFVLNPEISCYLTVHHNNRQITFLQEGTVLKDKKLSPTLGSGTYSRSLIRIRITYKFVIAVENRE